MTYNYSQKNAFNLRSAFNIRYISFSQHIFIAIQVWVLGTFFYNSLDYSSQNRAEKPYDPFWNRGVFVSQVDFPVCVRVRVPTHSFPSLLLQVLQIHSQAHMLEKQKEGCCTSAEQRMDALCHHNATSTDTFLTLFILKWNWCSAVTMLGTIAELISTVLEENTNPDPHFTTSQQLETCGTLPFTMRHCCWRCLIGGSWHFVAQKCNGTH